MLKLLLISMMLTGGQPGTYRSVEIYADSFMNPSFQQEIRELHSDEPGMRNREIKVVQIIRAERTADRFRQKHVKGNFTVILYGKDGGEKFRSTDIVSAQKLFTIIDAMP